MSEKKIGRKHKKDCYIFLNCYILYLKTIQKHKTYTQTDRHVYKLLKNWKILGLQVLLFNLASSLNLALGSIA